MTFKRFSHHLRRLVADHRIALRVAGQASDAIGHDALEQDITYSSCYKWRVGRGKESRRDDGELAPDDVVLAVQRDAVRPVVKDDLDVAQIVHHLVVKVVRRLCRSLDQGQLLCIPP